MSNVYTRNRKKTPFDVLANAEKLQDLVTLYVMNERYVPKKWRFMIGQDLIKKIDELNDNIIAANSIYAMNDQDLANRKAYAQKAIANGYQLQRKLSRLIRCVPSATAASLEEITSLLSQEIDDLKGWRKNDKIRAQTLPGGRCLHGAEFVRVLRVSYPLYYAAN